MEYENGTASVFQDLGVLFYMGKKCINRNYAYHKHQFVKVILLLYMSQLQQQLEDNTDDCQ